jgi:hypothetical protein
MKRTLAERSGRTYPHNAIYEILTYGTRPGERNEPKRYNRRTVNEYWRMLEQAPPMTRKAYELVYANGNTLKDAGRMMKISSTTVKNYLRLLYLTRDKHGYMVGNLDKISHSSYSAVKGDPVRLIESIDRYIDQYMDTPTELLSDQIYDVLLASSDGVAPEHIAGFYGLDEKEVSRIVEDFAKKCK